MDVIGDALSNKEKRTSSLLHVETQGKDLRRIHYWGDREEFGVQDEGGRGLTGYDQC